jgi:hypothetical protein
VPTIAVHPNRSSQSSFYCLVRVQYSGQGQYEQRGSHRSEAYSLYFEPFELFSPQHHRAPVRKHCTALAAALHLVVPKGALTLLMPIPAVWDVWVFEELGGGLFCALA